MLPTYADHDNDGLPDHVMGGDGLWQPFDPHTGTMLGGGSSLSPAPPARNSSTGVTRPGVGGGAQGRLPTPASPAPPSPIGGGGMPPAFRTGAQHPPLGGPPRQPGGMAAQQSSSPRQGQLGFNPSPLSQGGPRAFNASGHPYSGGGGGGDAIRGMIAGVRSNALSKIGAMMPGASSSSSSGYSSFPSSSAAPSAAPSPYYDPMSTALSTLVPMVGAIATGKNMDPRAVGAYQAVADKMIGHIMKKHDEMPLAKTSKNVRRKLF